MNRETKLEIIELARGYLGVGLMGWFGFWSNINYGQPFTHLWKFIITGGDCGEKV